MAVLSERGFSSLRLIDLLEIWDGKAALPSWADLSEVARQGFEIGGHTMTHPQLHRLNSDDLHSEVVQSKYVLKDKLGQEVKTFAYPSWGFERHESAPCNGAVQWGVQRQARCGAITR